MLRYEQSIRSEKIVKEYIEDDNAPLVGQLPLEVLQNLANEVNYYFQTDGDAFKSLRKNNESREIEWEGFLMKGVNIGVALPGKFPAEFSMSMEEYLEWLILIGKMEANTIRTYTILPPEFYNAFAQYNLLHHDKPLYLLQGVWATIPETHNYLDADYTRAMQKEITDVIDVLHGNAVLKPKKGKAHGIYSTDVSQYVAGILFGREWEPDGVVKTNHQNTSDHFQGHFIGVHYGTPMEVWLARMMDFIVLYETMTYSMQHMVSFVNWLPLDPLFHNTEFIENERVREYDNDLEYVDFMNFHASPVFFPGIFASYHVYPYYPDFIYLDPKYAGYLNEEGEEDNFRAYLSELKVHHQGMPLVIAEYGLPSSRGNSHQTPSGLDQGGHDELSHAHLNSRLTRNIFKSGCAGAIYFEWADEWFKHNWLVMDFEIPFENRKLWHNMENPEQNFGIMALEPERKILDGILDDWQHAEAGKLQSIRTSGDPSYFHIALPVEKLNFENRNIYIAIDIVPGEQGDHRLPFTEERFENGFEFFIEIINKDSARILVDETYSVYTDIFNDNIPDYRSVTNENAKFIEQLMFTNRGREFLTGEHVDSIVLNRSLLIFGNNSRPQYSNADWYYNDSTNILEMRLTWHLLNVTDPSKGCVLDNVIETPEIECLKTKGIELQIFVTDTTNKELYRIPDDGTYLHEWQTWKEPSFVQRLKPVYDSLRYCFKYDFYKPLQRLSRPVEDYFELCKFYMGHSNAVSFRFDKSAYSQYELAEPLLNKYRKKASFNIDKELRQEQAGYTITKSGKRLKTMGIDEVAQLHNKGHDIIETKETRSNIMVKASDLSAKSVLEKLKENKGWLVLQYEDITSMVIPETEQKSKAISQISQKELEKHLRLSRNTNSWIATEKDVFQYQKERDKANLKVNEFGQFIFVTIEIPFDTSNFDNPLCFYFYTQAPKIEVSGSEDDGFYQNRDGKILLHAKPGKELTIKKIW